MKQKKGRSRSAPSGTRAKSRRAPLQDAVSTPPPPFPIVGIGASAGGMEAFIELLQQIPRNTGMAFVLIQHLDPTHPSYLSEALARSTAFPVEEIQDGIRVEPDHVYVIPSNADVGIIDGALVLLARPTDGRRPHLPIDFFFRALAADRGKQAMAVVLSGTGSDGAEGLRAIKAEDGVTFAQEPRSAKFSGMPQAALNTGIVDFVLPLPELAAELVRVCHHPLVRGQPAELLSSPADDTELKKIFVLLRSALGLDFSEYKPASIQRRLARRLAVHQLTSLREYVPLLRDDPREAQLLCEDILIHVTSFFRDPEAFEQLKTCVFPELLKQKRGGGTIRIWTAGCSTGEEAYSIVIALLEFLALENASEVPIQLFGTDISEKAIERARAGIYPDGATGDVGSERLARYFSKLEGGGYRINKVVRERCAFVKHDLASDPPFSKLDLVTCRNVLIYFSQELQKRVMATFQFALNQPGFLLLGHAENTADGNSLFSVVDKENKIFARTGAKSVLRLTPSKDVFPVTPHTVIQRSVRALTSADIVKRAEDILLDQYAPAGVIVNERMEILHFRGRTGPYLEPAPGMPQHDLLKMARKGLMADLRIAISQAGREKTRVRRAGARIEQDGSTHLCDVVVIPVTFAPESTDSVFAVLFEEPKALEAPPAATGLHGPQTEAPPPAGARVDEQRFTKLEDELKATKDYLQSIIGEHQRTNEELMAANEELVSSNEELQSLNEELETAKEELQSTNEELSTLNEELHARNVELNSVNSDLVNILGSVEVPLVIVDAKRCIRRFTPKARPILNLLPTDVGRPIDDIKPNLIVERLDPKIAEVIETVSMQEEQVRGRDGRWYRLQIRPYLTLDKRVDGAVLSIVDIDALKRALGAAEWARDYARATVEAVQTPLLILDEKLKVLSANESFHETYGRLDAEPAGQSLYEVMDGAWNIPELRSALEGVLQEGQRFQRLDVAREAPRLGKRSLSLSGRSVSTPGGERMILLSVEDTTERLRGEVERARLLEEATVAKASAEEANRTKDVFLATLSHELRTPLTTLLLESQMLRHGNLDQARIQKAGASIERATKVQSQLIDDLLDISRIVTNKLIMHRRPFSVASTVRAAVDLVSPSAERKQVELDLHLDGSPPTASGDAMRIQQAVVNLLSNAIRFTPAQGRVSVMVDAIEGWARIRVTDTGFGIDPAFLPHIFDRFSQEDREQTRTRGGLGLGLAIVQSIIDAHGGQVQAASAGKGKGSTFTMLLPLSKDQGKPAPVAADEQFVPVAADEPRVNERGAGSIKDVRVLIVEDDPGTREALLEILGMWGADGRAAESAAGALAVFDEFRPELLVCDIDLPEEDGYSLLGKIRALGPLRGGDVPALALTAMAGEEDRRRALSAGFQMHMAKPVDMDQLAAALNSLLNAPIQTISSARGV